MKPALAILFILCCGALCAQPAFKLKRLDASTGLQYDERTVFTGEDEHGFVWIGSTNGPYRYDGQQLRHFRFSDDQKRTQVVSNFFSLGKDDVWFSYTDGLGHYSYANDELMTHDLDLKKPGPLGVQLIMTDSIQHHLWLANGNEILGVNAINPTKIFSRTTSQSVRHLALPVSDQGSQLLGFPWLFNPGLEHITISKEGSITVTPSKDPSLQKLTLTGGTIDSAGQTWLISTQGLHLYDYKKDRLLKSYTLPNKKNSGILDVETYGALLVLASTENGTWWFDPTHGKFWQLDSPVQPSKLPSPDDALTVSVTRRGVLYISRGTGGLDVLIPQYAKSEKLLPEISSHSSGKTVIQDQNGLVYTCTPRGELIAFSPDGERLKTYTPPLLEKESSKAFIALNSSDTLFYAIGQRLFKLDSPEASSLTQITETTAQITGIESLGDHILIFTKDGTYNFFNQHLTPIKTPFPEGSKTLHFNIGHQRLFINTLDGWGRIVGLDDASPGELQDSRLTLLDSLPTNVELLSAAYASTTDTLLIGSLLGLTRHVRKLDGSWHELDQPISGIRVVDIAFQRDSPTWLLTDQGLAVGQDLDWTFIKEEHGLPDASGLRGSLIVSDDSIVWAGFRGGLVRYQPSFDYKASSQKGTTYLQQVSLNEKELPTDLAMRTSGLTFSGRNEQLQLRLGTVNLYDQEAPTFRYRVLGGDEKWRSLGNSDRIYLEPLAPGSYTVEAKAINAAGTALETMQLKIQSTQPYWETWWFRLALLGAIGLFVAIISYAVYRRRLERERKKYEQELMLSQERERIARELHDDLGTDLSAILYLSDTEGEQLNAEDQAEVVSLSQTALTRMREIVHALDGGQVSIREIWKSMLEDTRATCRRYQVEFHEAASFEGSADLISLDNLTRRHVDLIVKETALNALRHGKPSALSLSLKQVSKKSFVFEISDDGKGFDEALIKRGMGLDNLQNRADRIGAELTIHSKIGEGTRIELTLPV